LGDPAIAWYDGHEPGRWKFAACCLAG